MPQPEDTSFARLVSLACHDLRTPLATVHGFVRTLARVQSFDEPASRYLRLMEAASEQMAQLLDDLGVAARIESRRYDAGRRPVDMAELARAAAARVGGDTVVVSGAGATVETEPEAAERAIAALARCAVRHGDVERVELQVDGAEVALVPVAPEVAPIVLGVELRDFGAAVARRVIEALDGSLATDGETLRVRLPEPSR
jgi:signal transduction histidine kinase